MKKFTITVFLLISMICSVVSQTLVYDNTTTETKILTYNTSGQLYNNQILKSIATANNKTSASLTVNYSLKLQITQQSNNQTLKSYIQISSISGDTEYKEFAIDDVLKPSKVNFKLNHIKNGTTLQTYSFSNVSVTDLTNPTGSKSVTIETPPMSSDGKVITDTYTIQVTDIDFIYDTQDKSKFDAKVTLIEKYYNSNTEVENALNKMSSIVIDESVLSKIDDLEKIVEYKSMANDNLMLCKSIKSELFYKSLSVETNDPEEMKESIELLNSKSTELLTVSNSLISKFDVLYYEKGMEQLKLGKAQLAQFNFNKSISYNSKYSPSHYQTAKINYDNDNSEGALTILNNIYAMSPDEKTLGLTNDLVTIIYSDYVDNATAQNTKKDYDKALTWLEKASKICNENKYIDCSAAMETAYKTAYTGKFDNYLTEVDVAYKAGNLTSAENALSIASKYQKTYSTYLTSEEKIIEKHKLIYEKYLANADAYYLNKKYYEALNDYLNAQRVCTANTYLTCASDLTTDIFKARTGIYTVKVDSAQAAYTAKKYDLAETTIAEANNYQVNYELVKDNRIETLILNIKQARYDTSISEGLTKVSGQDYTTALTKFDYAKAIENEYSVTKNKKLESYITSAAKSLILQKLEEGEKKVNINDLTSARTIYSEAIVVQSKYEIYTDKEVTTAITALNEQIFQQECLNYKSEYDAYYQKAVNYIFDADYISADTQLKLAVTVTSSHPECMLDGSNASYKKLEIQNAVTYQSDMLTAKTAIKNKSYQTGIEKYLAAQKFYNDNNLENEFSLTHVEFYTYISQSENDFVNYGVKYYTTEGDYDKALYLLSVLKKNNFNKKLTKEYQTNLGSLMAVRDHYNKPNSDVNTLLTELTQDDSYYKVFIKAYKKKWKSL